MGRSRCRGGNRTRHARPARCRRDVRGKRHSTALLAVAQEPGCDGTLDLHPAPGAQPRADDDLGARGPHLLHRLRRGGDAFRPAPLFRRRLAGPGADVFVCVRLEPLHDLAIVGQAAAEEVREERVRRVAGNRNRYAHGAVSIVAMVGYGGDTLPRTSIRRPPLTARLFLFAENGTTAHRARAPG